MRAYTSHGSLSTLCRETPLVSCAEAFCRNFRRAAEPSDELEADVVLQLMNVLSTDACHKTAWCKLSLGLSILPMTAFCSKTATCAKDGEQLLAHPDSAVLCCA